MASQEGHFGHKGVPAGCQKGTMPTGRHLNRRPGSASAALDFLADQFQFTKGILYFLLFFVGQQENCFPGSCPSPSSPVFRCVSISSTFLAHCCAIFLGHLGIDKSKYQRVIIWLGNQLQTQVWGAPIYGDNLHRLPSPPQFWENIGAI